MSTPCSDFRAPSIDGDVSAFEHAEGAKRADDARRASGDCQARL